MIEIVDDFIPVENQDFLEKLLIGNNELPYYYCLDTVEYDMEQKLFQDDKIIHQPQFVHLFYSENGVNSSFFHPIIQNFLSSSYTFENYKFKRLKVNLLTPPLQKRKNCYHLPHFDSKNEEDITVVYYVCDSDGDTFIFNESYNEDIPKSLSVKKKVKPKKGRALIFNSNQFHASSPPIEKDFRCVINMVFTLDNQ